MYTVQPQPIMENESGELDIDNWRWKFAFDVFYMYWNKTKCVRALTFESKFISFQHFHQTRIFHFRQMRELETAAINQAAPLEERFQAKVA